MQSPATNLQGRIRGSSLTHSHLLGTMNLCLGPDADPFANEGSRGTPHEPTEGLDLDQTRSDHSNPYDMVTMTTGEREMTARSITVERKRKKTYEIQKCMYDLPPFDPHFDPLVHNKYLAR